MHRQIYVIIQPQKTILEKIKKKLIKTSYTKKTQSINNSR